MKQIKRTVSGLSSGLGRWLRALPRGWMVAIASLVGVVLLTATVGMYRVYDYVQHDNDFCTGCHLMQDPFARFERSSHRGLGCKACHRPNIWERSSMGLIQIIERPDSMTRHAHVPSELCAECHVEGNPEEWKLIATSAGHRLHLESKDPKLARIECLTCHGAGVHNFAAADQSCGQAECHEQTKIQLGAMSNLTIHCASCHDFNRPVSKTLNQDSLGGKLRPAGNDCFSCHAMREKVGASIPVDEPHNAICGTCHNPHEDGKPADAVVTCATGACHERVDTVTAMHRGLASGMLQNCTACHAAHSWKAAGTECASCHDPDELDSPVKKPIKQLHVRPLQQNVLTMLLAPGKLLLQAVAEPPFRHKPHKSVPCRTCHESDDGHGAVKIKTAADCAGCHHSAQNLKACKSCHTRQTGTTYKRSFSWKLSVWKAPQQRTLSFDHKQHTATKCVSCHSPAARMRAAVDCTSCHTDHHQELRNCTACHSDVRDAHDEKAHLTCSGSGCHQDKATAPLRTQRNVCLACHTDMVKHEPQGDCASCHMIPKAKETRR
ncbi:MAG TPA: hypothetical protein VFO52_06905 [Longimicrobiales bacterium]|nr:hypothetical protein [Longimicrobiales bacterium]